MRTKLQVSISIPSDLLETVDAIARHEDRTRSQVLKRLLWAGIAAEQQSTKPANHDLE
jgi:metal-responsive CopG/Arc/MetJ family transcriptional regulator